MSRYAEELARQPDTLARAVSANADALAAARRLVTTARRVRVAGLGSSRHAAGYGAEVLDVVSGVSAHVLDAPGIAVPAPRFAPDDVLVVLSQSGRTPALVALADDAKLAGSALIAVVNEDAGALTAGADVVLRCGAGQESVIAATGSVTAQMLLLRALASPVTEQTVTELARTVGQVVASPPRIDQAPRRVVVGGLAGEWVAEEIALKLAEVAGVLATAESVVDFLHGPRAVRAATLALLDPDDPNSALVETGASTATLPVPPTSDPTTAPIVRVVAGQVAALAVATVLGVDPDDARGLSKVTMSA